MEKPYNMNYLILLSFIPWILYYVEIVYVNIALLENAKLKWCDYKYPILPLELIFLAIFLLLWFLKKITIIHYYFPIIYLILLVEFFRKLAHNCHKIKHKFIMVVEILLITLSVLSYIIFKNEIISYAIMFILSIFSYITVFTFSLVYKK